jgi:hypothetical protein
MGFAIDQCLMTTDILPISTTGHPLWTGVSMLRIDGPAFSAQELNRNQIALVHSFYFDGNIDQTIGLYHGGQDPGPLRSGRANLEDAVFLSKHPA